MELDTDALSFLVTAYDSGKVLSRASVSEGEAFTLDRFLELSFNRHRKDNALQTFGSVLLSLPQIPSDAFGSIVC